MKFYKTQALGNDFLIVERSEVKGDPHDLAKELCHRHFGAGSDGLIILSREGERFSFRIFNADGSEAEISGNGLRCAAAYVYYMGYGGEEVEFETLAGVRKARLMKREANRFIFEVSMGKPKLSSQEIPFDDGTPREKVVDYPLYIGNRTFPITVISVGNPHSVLFFENLPSSVEWKELGKEIEEHPFFPERTNVEFVKVLDRDTIQVLFWERGVGETFSSGSGACASAYAAYLKGLVGERVKVKTAAGDVIVEIEEGEIKMMGPAEVVFRGEWLK